MVHNSIFNDSTIISQSAIRMSSKHTSYQKSSSNYSSGKSGSRSSAPEPPPPAVDMEVEYQQILDSIRLMDELESKKHQNGLENNHSSGGTGAGRKVNKLDDLWYRYRDESLRSEDMEYINTLLEEHRRDQERTIRANRSSHQTNVPRTAGGRGTTSSNTSKYGRVGDSTTISCPCNIYELLQRGKYQFERQYGVKLCFLTPVPLSVNHNQNRDTNATYHIEVIHDDNDILEIAMSELLTILSDSRRFEEQLHYLSLQNTHIVVDNSNIFKGAQIIGINAKDKTTIRDITIRINVEILHRIVNNNRHCLRGFVSGSLNNLDEVKDEMKSPWVKQWKEIGYQVHAISQGIDGKEWGVDSAIVADVALHIHKVEMERLRNRKNDNTGDQSSKGSKSDTAPPTIDTLVMLTGDGNDNDGQASLFQAVNYALDKNWNVELWCWRLSVSQNYRKLAADFEKRPNFHLRFLDNFRDEFTYTVGPGKTASK